MARFSDPPGVVREANEGWLTLDWAVEEASAEGDGDFVFVVEMAREASFAEARERYRGRDGATFVSGLPEGTYYYRVRAERGDAQGPWSEPLVVTVHYVDRTHVWALMAAGTVAFFATVGTLIVNHRRMSAKGLEA